MPETLSFAVPMVDGTPAVIVPPDTGVPPDHWDALFEAVTTTLRTMAASQPEDGVGAAIVDCVRQLDFLQSTLNDERGRRRPRLVDMAMPTLAFVLPPAESPQGCDGYPKTWV